MYDRFAYMMKGICLRYAKNEAEAEDNLQESFIRAFRFLEKNEFSGNLGGWLRTITVNVNLEIYRKNKTAEMNLVNYEQFTSDHSDLENAMEKLALEDLVMKIQRLPIGFRTVFNLYAIEGFTHPEIAEKLEISVGTSKSQYSRARALLREWIEVENKQEMKQMNYAKK